MGIIGKRRESDFSFEVIIVLKKPRSLGSLRTSALYTHFSRWGKRIRRDLVWAMV
jgi:hypothetical protein